jgi:hypothetical protein
MPRSQPNRPADVTGCANAATGGRGRFDLQTTRRRTWPVAFLSPLAKNPRDRPSQGFWRVSKTGTPAKSRLVIHAPDPPLAWSPLGAGR